MKPNNDVTIKSYEGMHINKIFKFKIIVLIL